MSLEVLEELKPISINWQRWDVSVIDTGFDDELQLYIFAQANLMVNKFFNKILFEVTFPNGSTINFQFGRVTLDTVVLLDPYFNFGIFASGGRA